MKEQLATLSMKQWEELSNLKLSNSDVKKLNHVVSQLYEMDDNMESLFNRLYFNIAGFDSFVEYVNWKYDDMDETYYVISILADMYQDNPNAKVEVKELFIDSNVVELSDSKIVFFYL